MLPSRRRPITTRFVGNDRFQVIRPLGSGGMGEVYEVLDREHDLRVALKVLRRNDPRFLYRFKQEFRTVQPLQHPNLASLGQLHEHDGAWFFTMELIQGVDFRRHVVRRDPDAPDECADTLDVADHPDASWVGRGPDRSGPRHGFDEKRLRDGLRQLCEALHFLHAAGRIHRDIKPSNVMVTRDGRVVLLDFGLVTHAAPELQSVDVDIVGTPIYMAPEQATGKMLDHSVDCYALGVMLFEVLTGDAPFTGSLTEILVKKQCATPPDPRGGIAGIPDDLALLCMRLLAADPARRPTAAEALELLCGRPDVVETGGSGGRPAVFLGRDQELAALRASLDESIATGEPRVVHVEAESGVGKSSLIDRFSAQVRGERDARVLSGRCYEREMTNYRAFDAVVDAVVRILRHVDEAELAAATPADAWLLVRMFPMFGSVPGFGAAVVPADATTEHDARRRAYLAFAHVLGALAARAPLVIVVDDVQWADSDSMRLLAELVRAPGPAVLWVLASRPLGADDPRGSSQQWLVTSLRVDARHLALAPLPTDLARQLAEELLGRGDHGIDAEAIAREAGGHPLHIAELVRHAAAGGGLQHLRLDEAILQRLSRLPAAARELADVLALAGAPLRPATLRRAAEVSPLDFERAVAVLRLGHLARRSGAAEDELLEPYHDRVREAVTGRLTSERRRLLHTRVAAALTAAGTPSELLVRHFEGAGAPARAAECALDAAQRATTAMAYDRATELYQTALRLGSYTDAERRDVQIRLGEAFIRAGRGREAAAVYAEAAEGADQDTRLHCRLQSSEQLLLSGHIDDGMRAIVAVLGDVGTPLPPTPRHALVALLRHRFALRLRGPTFTLRRESQIARDVLARLDVYRAVGHGLSMVDNVRGAVFNSHFLRMARRVGEPLRLSRALGVEAMFLGSQGDAAGEQRVIAQLEELTATVDATYARAWLEAARGCRDFFAGHFWSSARRFDTAEALCHEARTEASDVPSIRVLRGFALRHAGEVRQLQPLHDRWLVEAEQRGDLFLETALRRGYTMLRLARGDTAGAARALDGARWTTAPGSFHLQHWYDVEARVELAMATGDAAAAVPAIDRCMADLRSSHIDRLQIVRCVARWLQARVHLAAARGPEAIQQACRRARRTAARLRGERVGYAMLWAALLTASERSVAGDRDGAIQALRAASALGVDDLRFYGTMARHRLAGALGGTEGNALADTVAATCAELGVAELAPLAAVFTPGFDAR